MNGISRLVGLSNWDKARGSLFAFGFVTVISVLTIVWVGFLAWLVTSFLWSFGNDVIGRDGGRAFLGCYEQADNPQSASDKSVMCS
jgi:hypothetical protein